MPDGYFYLAGPMTGIPQYNFPAFDRAAAALRKKGYRIQSPAELDSPEERVRAMASADGSPGDYGNNWRWPLRRDADIVMNDDCIGVICIEGWEASRGAKLETYIAEAFDKPIYRVDLDKNDEPTLTLIENRAFAIVCYEAAQEVV